MPAQQNRSVPLLTRRRFLGVGALGALGAGVAAACGGGGKSASGEPAITAVPLPSDKVAQARDAVLPPVSDQRTIDLTLEAVDAIHEVAAGMQYRAWTYEGSVPGPVIHMRQGDTMNFKFVNSGTLGHSIDFHAAQLDWEVNYRTIEVGQSLEFQWTAELPGAFMYHCGTPAVLHHIGNGMYGAIIIEPEGGYLQPADREYWLVQSEFYLMPAGTNAWTGDMNKMKLVRPDIVAFNGTAFQYRDNPLQGKVGERIRFQIVNSGPTLWSAFHVIGAMFDVTYVDGNPRNPLYGLQTHSIPPGGGATCDVVIGKPGKYPIVSHNFAYTELGVVGLLEITE